MGIYDVLKCVVEPQKHEEFTALLQKYVKYKEGNPEKFKEMKSFRVFNQMLGIGAYILIWEYDSLEDFNNLFKRLSNDEEGNRIWQEIMLLIDPAKYSHSLWNAVDITPIWEMNRQQL